MKTVDPLPEVGKFDRPMYTLAVETPYNIKFYRNDCPGCIRAWEMRLRRRGWIDLGPNWGLGRIAPVLRMWAMVGSQNYDELYPEAAPAYQYCCPEQLDGYDEDGLLYSHQCGMKMKDPQQIADIAPEDDPWDDECWDDAEEDWYDED